MKTLKELYKGIIEAYDKAIMVGKSSVKWRNFGVICSFEKHIFSDQSAYISFQCGNISGPTYDMNEVVRIVILEALIKSYPNYEKCRIKHVQKYNECMDHKELFLKIGVPAIVNPLNADKLVGNCELDSIMKEFDK